LSDDKEVVITQLDAKTGMRLFKKLQKVLTPAIFNSMMVVTDDEGKEQQTLDMVMLMTSISEAFDEFETDEIIKAIALSVGKKEDDISNEYAGKYLELFKLFSEIVILNFNDTFIAIGFDL